MDKTGHMTIAAHAAGSGVWNLSGGAGGGNGLFTKEPAPVPFVSVWNGLDGT